MPGQLRLLLVAPFKPLQCHPHAAVPNFQYFYRLSQSQPAMLAAQHPLLRITNHPFKLPLECVSPPVTPVSHDKVATYGHCGASLSLIRASLPASEIDCPSAHRCAAESCSVYSTTPASRGISADRRLLDKSPSAHYPEPSSDTYCRTTFRKNLMKKLLFYRIITISSGTTFAPLGI